MRNILMVVCRFSGYYVIAQNEINWSPHMNIAASFNGNNHPRIATDASGNPLVIWSHASRVMFSLWNGAGFESPRILNPVTMTVAGASWMGPDIAAHGDTVYVVYKETPEDVGHIWLLRSFDGGATFSDPVQVDDIGAGLSRFPTVTTDDTGQPVIGFMKFNSTFGQARWVVTRSYDHGESFTPDVLASGWSSPTSVVCDCCPGAIVASGEHVAMLYRDNNNNVRDTWAGFSPDGGESFLKGIINPC